MNCRFNKHFSLLLRKPAGIKRHTDATGTVNRGKICPKMPLASQTDTLYLLWKIVSHFKTVMTMRDFFLQLFITLICFARWT
ncbi:hypothetical protein FTV95_13270 [Escherichia coli]|nr:hypothetical protein FTV95_13270 [Escherichia coli]